MTYRVRLDLFEGPLDLLLHLIKSNEVDVKDIPVATITEQYLAYLELMRDLNLDVASEYLVMAATLTLIKSRLLLPSPDPAEPLPVRVTLWELMEAFRAVLTRAQPDPVHQVEAEPVSLRDRIGSLLRTLGVARHLTFDSLFGDNPTRGFVIVTFLAVLELAKLGAIEAVQEETAGPILIVLAVEDVSQVTVDLLEEYAGTPASGAAAGADD